MDAIQEQRVVKFQGNRFSKIGNRKVRNQVMKAQEKKSPAIRQSLRAKISRRLQKLQWKQFIMSSQNARNTIKNCIS